MDVFTYLKKVLPDLDMVDPEIRKITYSDVADETKVMNILTYYFNRKKSSNIVSQSSDEEAYYIKKLFPSLSFSYILKQLEIFKDMPNRKEIALRIIVSSKMYDDGLNSTVKLSTSTSQPANQCDDYYCSPLKIRKIATGTASVYKVVQSNNESRIPKPLVTKKLVLSNSHTNNKIHGVKRNLVQQEDALISNVPKADTSISLVPPRYEENFREPIKQEKTQTSNISENQSNFEGHSVEQEMEILSSKIKAEDELPVAEVFTISSSILKPQEDLEVINEYINEKMFTVEQDQDKSSNYLSNNHLVEESVLPVARNYTVTSNVSEVLDNVEMNDALLPKSKGDEVSNVLTVANTLQMYEKCQKVAPVVSSSSRNCIQEYQVLEHATATNDNLHEQHNVETTPIGDIIQHLNKMSKLRSAQDPQTKIVPLGIQPKFAKPTASATVTSQSHLDQTVSSEPQKTITSIALGLRNKGNVATAENPSSVNQLVTYLCGIFPDAAPKYIRGLCKNKPMTNEVLDDLTTVILNTNGTYPKRPAPVIEPDVFPENQLDILKEFLPEADPDYLRMMCDKFAGKPDMVKSFINEAMELRNYPTMKDYQRRQQLSAQEKQYTTEFSAENFIKLIPDPHTFFSDPQRTIKMDSLSSHYALVFLRNTFNKLSLRIIQSTFTKNNCKLYKTIKELQQAMTQKHLIMKSTRKPMEMPNSIQNIPLLQEIAYFAHEKEVNDYLQEIKDKEEAERKEALSRGLMKTCKCCYDEEVLPKNIFCCEKRCPFCKICIIKSTEVSFGEGKLDFPCLMNCSSYFTLQTLQAVLSPKLFSKIAQKKALEEIKSAGIEELEMCPFCDFATIPAEGYNIFSCLNPECMKESCRLCKEPSHIPLKCEEIEKDEDVKARTFVENKMTEALLKKCWKCGIKFFKEEGCNKMTCSCGALMCYICGSRVTDYKHFNGNGGDRFDLCPLYSDTNVLNKENVLRGAAEAKAEIGNKALKHDPTSDVQQHFKDRSIKVPQQHIQHIHNVNQRQRVEAVFLGVREAIDQLEQRYPQFPF